MTMVRVVAAFAVLLGSVGLVAAGAQTGTPSQCTLPRPGLALTLYRYKPDLFPQSGGFNVNSPFNNGQFSQNSIYFDRTTTHLVGGPLNFDIATAAAAAATLNTFPFGATSAFIADFNGFIRLPPGAYDFQVTSNNGVVLDIGNGIAQPPNQPGFNVFNFDGAGTGTDTATTFGVQITQAVTPFRLTFSKYPPGYFPQGTNEAPATQRIQLVLKYRPAGVGDFKLLNADNTQLASDFCCPNGQGISGISGTCTPCADGPACINCQNDPSKFQCKLFDIAQIPKGCPTTFVTIATGQRCGGDRNGCCQASNIGSQQNQYPACNNPFVASKPAYCGMTSNGHAVPWSCPSFRCNDGASCACNAPDCTCTNNGDFNNYLQNIPPPKTIQNARNRCQAPNDAFASPFGCFY